MKNLVSEISVLFDLCDKANLALKSVDSYAQKKIMTQVQKQSKDVFMMLENVVNPMGKKDLLKELPDRKVLLRLYFIIMKSLYLFSKKGVTRFEDARSQGSTMLAHKLIKDLGFERKFGQSQTWINNDTIYTSGLMVGLRGVHPTLLQNLVRCMTMTLVYPEVQSQVVPDYMIRFESYIFYYLMQCEPEKRIYLDFV